MRPMITLSEIVYHTDRCSKCAQIKTRDEFGPAKNNRTGLHSHCRQCLKQAARELYNTDHGRETKRKYRQSNHGHKVRREWQQSDRGQALTKKHRQTDHYKERRNKLSKERWTTDPKYKMSSILRRRLNHALHHAKHGKALKHSHTLDILGCSMDFFMQYIEQQFQPGMTWQNHGQWHIDHRVPCATFDLIDPAQQKTCFHFSNMQPLWAEDNLKKGCRL